MRWESVSHRAMQLCSWSFPLVSFGSLWYTVIAFSEPLWSSCLDAWRLICSLTMVCLPHTSLQVFLPPLVTVRQWLGAAIMSLLATGNSRSRRVRRAASPLTTGSRQRRWVSSLAPSPVDLVDNYLHKDRETDIRTPSVYREMEIELSITTETKKLTTRKLCETMRWSYSWKEIWTTDRVRWI
jgi:hypothetical protein